MRFDRRLASGLIMIGILIVALGLLQASGSSFWEGQAILLAIFVVLTVSLNLVSGFTGLFSLGHIGFMALGVYISAVLTLSLEKKAALLPDLPGWLAGLHLDQMAGPVPLGWLIATVVAGLLVSLIALAVGSVIMRLSGNFVAVATLGFLVIVRVMLINADGLTRGSRTFSGVTPFTDLWWSWAWAVVTIYVVWRIKRSPWGRQMFAQKADKWAAQSVGIPILRPRLLAFVISAFFGAVAGSLYAHHIPGVLTQRLLLRPHLRGHHDARRRRAGLGDRLGPGSGRHRGHHRGPPAGAGRDPALRPEWHRAGRVLPGHHHLPAGWASWASENCPSMGSAAGCPDAAGPAPATARRSVPTNGRHRGSTTRHCPMTPARPTTQSESGQLLEHLGQGRLVGRDEPQHVALGVHVGTVLGDGVRVDRRIR